MSFSTPAKLLSCLLLAFECLRPAPAQPPLVAPAGLTNVAQIRRLTTAEAAQGLPVRLQGVMISEVASPGRALILADQTGCLFMQGTTNELARYRRGDRLAIEGRTSSGQFAPMVTVSTASWLGAVPVPAPRPVSYQQLITGSLDAQWVEITGIVRQYIRPATNSEVWRILLSAHGGIVSIRGNAPPDPRVQEDAEIRVPAICFYQYNRKRQVLSPVLEMPSLQPVAVVKTAPANPFDAPVRSANSLLQFSPDNATGHRVHVKGVVTHARPGSLVWIRDPSSGLRIQARQKEPLQAGDEIDVLGFPAYGSYSPLLEDAIFRKTGTTASPTPLRLTNAVAATDHEDDLIQLDAELTDVQPALNGLLLTLRQSNTVFKAVLDVPIQPRNQAKWLPGSTVRVTGICSVIHDVDRPFMGVWIPQSFQLLLRSPHDLIVLTRPPWWNPRRIATGLAIGSAGLLLGSGLLILLFRRRLHAQARRRREMAEAEFAAILTERNRVAREIHDTLAQDLAAISVQLRLAKKMAADQPAALNHHLDTAQQFVRDSLEQARNSIWNMRSQVLETGDLADALGGILKQVAEGSSLQTAFQVTGRGRRFAPVIENNLLRLGQEAITNAARHAQAQSIRVTLDFGEKQFRLSVRDDGRGFDPATPPPSEGGFGLVGMRERAAELKAELNIHSTPGQGTEIILHVPLLRE